MYLPARCSSLTGIVRARPVVALPAGLALEARLLLPGARDLEELVDLLWISCGGRVGVLRQDRLVGAAWQDPHVGRDAYKVEQCVRAARRWVVRFLPHQSPHGGARQAACVR